MKYTKKEPRLEYVEKLRKFLKKNPNYLVAKNNKAITQEEFDMSDIKIDRTHLILYDEFCIFQLASKEVWICKHTRTLQKYNGETNHFRRDVKLLNKFNKTMDGAFLMPKFGD